MLALLVRAEHYARKVVGFFVALEALQLVLALLGLLFIAQHATALCGYTLTLRSPLALKAIPEAPQVLVRK